MVVQWWGRRFLSAPAASGYAELRRGALTTEQRSTLDPALQSAYDLGRLFLGTDLEGVSTFLIGLALERWLGPVGALVVSELMEAWPRFDPNGPVSMA